MSAFFWVPVNAAEPFTGYLFAYFTGNSKNQEAIRFAISNDGHTYKALNKNNPVISSAAISLTGGIRDPHILRGENNDYYMVATDMVSANGWASNYGIVMLKSTNLIDWKTSTVDFHQQFPTLKSADRVWAPQTIYDASSRKYMVYFAMRLGASDKDKLYYAYADSSFSKLESTPKILYTYGTSSAIDGDIIFKDSTFHLFFKTEGDNTKGIKSATSRTLTSGYTLLDKYLQPTSAAVEGSCVFKLINSENYVLMYDVYTSGKYEFALSTDLKTFKLDPAPISFDFTPRHGTVIPITDKDKNALNAKWNPTGSVSKSKYKGIPRMVSITGAVLTVRVPDVSADLDMIITDMSGKPVHRTTIDHKESTLRMGGLLPGVYLACIRNGNCQLFAGCFLVR